MIRLNQKGFSAVFIVLVVVLFGVGGFVIWRVSQVEELATVEPSLPISPEKEKTYASDTNSISIPDLGLIVFDPENRGLEYYKKTQEDNPTISLSFSESHLIKDEKTDTFDGCNLYPAYVRLVNDEEASTNLSYDMDSFWRQRTVQVGHYYFVVGPGEYYQSPCAPNGEENTAHTEYAHELQLYIRDNLAPEEGTSR